jgi:hypothetical protein
VLLFATPWGGPVSFTEAIRKSVWVRRRGWSGWVLVSPKNVQIERLTRTDLLANDWEAHHSQEGLEEHNREPLPETKEEEDETSTRFGLLEFD